MVNQPMDELLSVPGMLYPPFTHVLPPPEAVLNALQTHTKSVHLPASLAVGENDDDGLRSWGYRGELAGQPTQPSSDSCHTQSNRPAPRKLGQSLVCRTGQLRMETGERATTASQLQLLLLSGALCCARPTGTPP